MIAERCHMNTTPTVLSAIVMLKSDRIPILTRTHTHIQRHTHTHTLCYQQNERICLHKLVLRGVEWI